MPLTRDQILTADDAGLLEVHVPEWNGSVFIRVMSVGERDSFENDWTINKHRGLENFRAKLLQRVLCDERGELLFTVDDMPKLASKSARVMSRLFNKAIQHNAVTDADVEELAKN